MSEQDEAAAAEAAEREQIEQPQGGAEGDSAEVADPAAATDVDAADDGAAPEGTAGDDLVPAAPAEVIPGAPPSAQPTRVCDSVGEGLADARRWVDEQNRWSSVERTAAHEVVTYLGAVLGA